MTGRGEIPPGTRSNLQERVKRRNHTERRDLRSEIHIAVINHINTRKIKKEKRRKSTSTVK